MIGASGPRVASNVYSSPSAIPARLKHPISVVACGLIARNGIATPLLNWVGKMPLYRFNLEDHHFIADRGSHDCLDDEHAIEVANEIAERLVQSQPELMSGGHAIVVRDAGNRQIYRAEMDVASVMQRRH